VIVGVGCLVGAFQLHHPLTQPLQLLNLGGGRQIGSLAMVGLVAADPGPQDLRVDAELTGDVGDRPARCSERHSRTARSRNSSGYLRGAAIG